MRAVDDVHRPIGPASAPSRHVPGEAGVWVLLFGDMVVFAVLFGVYLYYRGQQVDVFERSQEALNRNLGAANTLLLLVSSLLVLLAVRAVRGTQRHLAPRLVLGALTCGVCFIVVKIIEYYEKVDAGITPTTDDFYMYYFILTGLHLFHLIIGIAVLGVLWNLSRKPSLTSGQLVFLEGGACFWHMVDLLWIVLFPLLFLAR